MRGAGNINRMGEPMTRAEVIAQANRQGATYIEPQGGSLMAYRPARSIGVFGGKPLFARKQYSAIGNDYAELGRWEFCQCPFEVKKFKVE